MFRVIMSDPSQPRDRAFPADGALSIRPGCAGPAISNPKHAVQTVIPNPKRSEGEGSGRGPAGGSGRSFPGLVLCGLAALLLAAAPCPADPERHDTAARPIPKPPAWREVSYSASKFLLRASTTMRVDLVPSSSLKPHLRTSPEGTGVPPPASRLFLVEANTDMPFGRSEEARTWLDPLTGAAIQTEKTALRRRPYRQVYRYPRQGVDTWRTAPADAGEEGGEAEKWSQLQTQWEPVDRPLPEHATLTDAYALLVLLSLHPFERQEEQHTHFVLTDERLVKLTFTAGALTTAAVDFDEIRGSSRRRRSERIVVRPVTVSGSAVAEGSGGRDVDLGFLGMRGSLTVLLEAETGIPVEVSGRVERIGNLVVRLTRTVLREQ